MHFVCYDYWSMFTANISAHVNGQVSRGLEFPVDVVVEGQLKNQVGQELTGSETIW